MNDGDIVSLVETTEVDGAFVALSYCWGNVGVLTSTLSSIEAHKTGISWHLLPKTFQEAIIITRRLRIPYLWIDALCIVQDSPDDWQAESSKMSQIYEIADLAISADLAPNNNAGFLGRRRGLPHTIELPKSPNVKSTATQICCFLSENPVDQQHTYFVGTGQGSAITISSDGCDPVFDRAWCLQERFLATKLLHFTSTEMIWECKLKIRCECEFFDMAEGHLDSFGTKLAKPEFHRCILQSSPKAKLSRWWRMVEEYSLRGLTKETDRLPAISGLASRMAGPELGEYLAVMWRENLLLGLLWQ